MISKYQVMRSNAGHYVGRDEDGMPYDRISDYGSRSEMEEMLEELYTYHNITECGCIYDKQTNEHVHQCSDCQLANIR